MSKEGESGGIVGPQSARNCSDEIGKSSRNEINITGVYDAENRFAKGCREEGEVFSERFSDPRALIEFETGSENSIIKGFVHIAKGRKPTLLITSSQEDAFAIIYGMLKSSKVPYYASIRSTGREESKEIKKAQIKIVGIRPFSVNHLTISKGLAKKLGVKEGQPIIITDVYQDTSKLNLDKL